MTAEFVHLHVHSQYSLLDGALRVKDLAKKAKGLGMRSVALTDHGNMFGTIQHWLACKEQGIGAIVGCEINVARKGARTTLPRPAAEGPGGHPGDDLPVDHLVLLAADLDGYKNLVRIVSAGHLEPASSRAPSVLLDVVERNRKGIIALSGCMGGVVAQEILEKGEEAGRATLDRLRGALEPGNLYVELQDHGMVEQPVLNDILARAAEDMGLPLVASNDVHFPGREDGEGQLYLQCIANNRSFAQALEHHHGSWEMFLKPAEEMVHLFRDRPQAVRSTLEIAERCSALKLKLGEPMLPNFRVPEGFDEPGYFRHVAREGLRSRFEEIARTGRAIDHDAYQKRLEVELDVICGMKFPGYFLIVWDFIRYAKEHGIPVGPGRGSGAGSLVAYAMRITDLDPLPYNLLFERFLNPERVSMPDFDVDFCMDRRDEVIRYVGETYGARSVGQIATFHELKSRSVLKDVARTMGLPANEAGRIAGLVPQKGPGVMYTIPEALEIEPKLKALVETDPTVKELVHQAMKLEGLTRHAGMHAAGVVISEGPLDDHVPCFRNGDMIVTQYHKDDVEKAGLVKFDFLGLKTLTVVDIAVRLVDARPDRQGKEKLDIAAIPLDDKETYELLQSGETTGVFQLESSGMQQLFKDLKPTRFEDIVAAVALYRPGPLGTGMVKDFVDCKHGRKPIAKMHPLVDELLEPTYGVIVYQEQVMQITQMLAGYSLGGADLLRRAMGKKKPEEMAKQKTTFVAGAKAKGVTEEDADRIFALLEYFAGYGFNKCVIGDTVIVEATTGERTTVGDLFRSRRPFRIHALGDDGKLRPREVVDVVSNGRKKVFEVVTAQGKRIVATGNHPFRTLDGWTRLDALQVGDGVATPRRLAVATTERWSEHELVTLAGLLSEGNTCHPSCLYFFGNERRLVDDFARAASSFPSTVARVTSRADGRHEVCVSTGRDARFQPGQRPWNASAAVALQGSAALAVAPEEPLPRRSGAWTWAESLGLLGRKATDKRVPAALFRARDEDVALFLGRLWAGDGFFFGPGNTTPFYATSSEGLARDVSLLLLRLGITSGIHRKTFRYRGGERAGFTVHLVGDGAAETFLDVVAPHAVGRDGPIEILRTYLGGRPAGLTSKDTIPAGVRRWVDEERRRAGLTWKQLEELAGVSAKELQGAGSSTTKRGFRRSTIAALGRALGSRRLADVSASDVFWDRVASIRPLGVQETFDLTVAIDHNFVADGLVVHNSHSAAYALVTYQTAFLKAHYPVEFLCALMTADKDKIEKVVRIIAEGRAWGVETLPPSLNESMIDFTVVYGDPTAPRAKGKKSQRGKRRARDPYEPKIRFGLGAVRGLGEAALEAILEVRNDGTFGDLFDLAERVDAKRVNKGVLEALVASGALDELHAPKSISRAMAFAAIDKALERSRNASRDRERGQTSLFGLFEQAAKAQSPGDGNGAAARASSEYPEVEPWDLRETLVREKEALGFYVSGHPLDRYGVELGRFDVQPAGGLASMDAWAKVRVAGVVEGYRQRIFKGGGGKVAFFTLEDPAGRVEVKVREKHIDLYEHVLTSGEPVLVSGKLQFPQVEEGEEESSGTREPTLLLDEVVALADAIRAQTRSIHVKLPAARTAREQIERLRVVLAESPGSCPVQLTITLDDGAEALFAIPSMRVEPSDVMLARLEKLFGERVVELR